MTVTELFPKRVMVKIDIPEHIKKGIAVPSGYKFLKTRGVVERVGENCKFSPGDRIIIKPLACVEFESEGRGFKILEDKHVLLKIG